MTLTQHIKDAIENSPDWQDATCKIIDIFTQEGQPFSSGEVAKELRTHRPDFVFGHRGLGNFIQDLHWTQAIKFKDAADQPILAFQVPRVTKGVGRTPAGVEVFVYAPTKATGNSHDFEVDVPPPQFGATPQTTATPPTTTPSTPRQTPSFSATRDGELTAKVQGDKRIRVPRHAFDALSHKSGHALQGGDDVFIAINSNEVSIYFDQQPGASRFSLSRERGAVRFHAPDNVAAFAPGSVYGITVEPNRLVIDLNDPQ